MDNDIDLGKISITPKGDWNDKVQVEYNDIWRYNGAKYLSIQDSTGIVPSDDGVYWYELSSQGESAYQLAVENGFVGSEVAWIQSLKQPALDGEARADAAIANMDKRFPDEISKVQSSLYNQLSSDLSDKVVKPLVISSAEELAGQYKMNGEVIDIYERSVSLSHLPKVAGEAKVYVVSDELLGYGAYMNVESFVASTGVGLTKDFFQFNFEILRCFINESLQSCIEIRCKSAISEAGNISAVAHLQYCKFPGDVIEFTVNVPDGIDKEAIQVTIPPVKYNKKKVFSYITDDSYNIYQYIFAGINKRMVARWFGNEPNKNNYAYHYGMQGHTEFDQHVSGQYYPEHFLQCTDGAGVKHRYSTMVACWPDKLRDQGRPPYSDVGMQWPWISEKEFLFYQHFGFSLGYHDLQGYDANITTQAQFDQCVENTVKLFNEYVQMIPKTMIEPNGDHKYLTFSQGNDIIQNLTAQSGDKLIKKAYPFKSGFSLSKYDIAVERQFAYGADMDDVNDNPQYATDMLKILDDFSKSTDKTSIYWLICAAHRSSHWELVFFRKIHELYGDIGDDSLWFPTLDEFFEYWYMRANSTIVKQITDTGINVKVYVPKRPNFWFRDISCMLSGITDIAGISVTSGNNVFGTSYAINDNRLLVNLDFNERTLESANYFVEQFEKDYNAEYAYDNAYYFVQKLKKGLRETYEARLNKWTSPPILLTFKINDGAKATKENTVTITTTYDGQSPSHILISENVNFSGAEWQTYASTVDFTLSSGFNIKTLYCKLKNVYGNSAVLSSQIEYLEPDLVLTGISIFGGAASTTGRDIQLSFAYTGFPTHYMLSESTSFDNVEWQEWVVNPHFTLSESFGQKLIYGKLKNAKGETDMKSTTVELIDTVTARLNSIIINNGDDATNSGTMSVEFETLNTITKYKIGKQADLSDCPDWIVWAGSTVQYQSGIADGNLTVYAQVGNETTESSIKSDSILVVQPVVLGGITLADGKDSFAGYTVPVSFEISQGTPTHYRLSETSAGLTSASWLTWKDGITYKFSTIGSKTLNGQVKNALSESDIVNDSIDLTESPVKALIAFNATVNNTIDYPVVNGDTINQTILSTHSSYGAKQLKDNQGNLLPWYINYNSEKYIANAIFADNNSNNYDSNTTANDDGIYPADTFKKCRACMNNVADGSRKLRNSLSLPSGKYKARILYSPADNFLLEEKYRANSYYGVFAGEILLAKANVGTEGFTGKGNNQYNNEFEFTVPAKGDIDFAAWQEGSPIGNYRPGMNLIELTKLS